MEHYRRATRWTTGRVDETADTELAVAGVLQLPGFPLALALCAGRGDAQPIGKADRGEQRQDALEQLPTGTHECQIAPSDVYSESARDAFQRVF